MPGSSQRLVCRLHLMWYAFLLLVSVAPSGIFLFPKSAWAELTAIQQNLYIEYPISGDPLYVKAESPSRIWYTAPQADIVGLLEITSQPGDPVMTYRVDVTHLRPGSEPYGLAIGNDSVWFTQRNGNRLGRIFIANGQLQEYPLPTSSSGPSGIDVAPNGTVWLVEESGNKIVRFDPNSEQFIETAFPANLFRTATPLPRAVAVQSDSIIWFTAFGADALVAYNADAGNFFVASTATGSGPRGIVIDENGIPWISWYNTGLIARYAPGTLQFFITYPLPRAESQPVDLTLRTMGAVREFWYAARNVDRVGRLQVTPDGDQIAIQEFTLLPGSQPWGIDIADDETVWIAQNGRNALAELRVPYAYTTYVPVISTR